jgi:hypothetical protein
MMRMREGTGRKFGSMILANISTHPGIRIETCTQCSTDTASALPVSPVQLVSLARRAPLVLPAVQVFVELSAPVVTQVSPAAPARLDPLELPAVAAPLACVASPAAAAPPVTSVGAWRGRLATRGTGRTGAGSNYREQTTFRSKRREPNGPVKHPQRERTSSSQTCSTPSTETAEQAFVEF